MRSFMFDILQGDMTRSKVILTFTCLKMYIARSGDTSGSRTTLFNKMVNFCVHQAKRNANINSIIIFVLKIRFARVTVST